MRIMMADSAVAAARLAARSVMEVVRRRPDAVLGLATGRTMAPVYAELGRLHREERLDFGACRFFNLDEYIGLEAHDPHSFRQFMQRHFARVVNVDPGRLEFPGAAVGAYERAIATCGGIDLQLLGIGENGHIGFNEPGTSFDARTHVVTLTARTRLQNAETFGSVDAVPAQAITMGIGTILEARRIVLLATGEAKATALADAVQPPGRVANPCSALQSHADCTVITDRVAGGRLEFRLPA